MTDHEGSTPGRPRSIGDGDAVERLVRLAPPRREPSAEASARIRSAVHDEWRRTLRTRRRRAASLWGGALAAAAALVLAVGVASGRMPWLGSTAIEQVGELARTVGDVRVDGETAGAGRKLDVRTAVATGADGRAAVRLASGTVVRLDHDTALRIRGAALMELDRGRVYVDTESARAGRGSIEIRTPMGGVRDIGTQFEVSVGTASLSVRVRRGTVRLSRREGLYDVAAGRGLHLTADGTADWTDVPSWGASWDWALGLAAPFRLEGSTLEQFVSWLDREYGWSIVYLDSELAGRAGTVELHGDLGGVPPELIPSVVLDTCGIDHRLEEGHLFVGTEPPVE